MLKYLIVLSIFINIFCTKVSGLITDIEKVNKTITERLDRLESELSGTHPADLALLSYKPEQAGCYKEWLVLPDLTLDDPENIRALEELQSLSTTMRTLQLSDRAAEQAAEKNALILMNKELETLERKTKDLWFSIMDKIKKNSHQELAKTFEANFKKVLEPTKAFERLGFTLEEAKQTDLATIQARWKNLFANAEIESNEEMLGRQIWYVIKNDTQRQLYISYLQNSRPDSEVPLALEEAMEPMTKIAAELYSIRKDIEQIIPQTSPKPSPKYNFLDKLLKKFK